MKEPNFSEFRKQTFDGRKNNKPPKSKKVDYSLYGRGGINVMISKEASDLLNKYRKGWKESKGQLASKAIIQYFNPLLTGS
uniref:Uncharacterized protein n=1 Tax=viral metagenome TaxID=1070528 RepID=A0A6H2A463_9ZZZZ